MRAWRPSRWTNLSETTFLLPPTEPDAARVLALRPDWTVLGEMKLGLVGPLPAGHEAQFELRALFGSAGMAFEDPVTGSLNASVAQWLIGAGLAPARYVASPGTVLQRVGRVYIDCVDGQVWVGGDVAACVRGELAL